MSFNSPYVCTILTLSLGFAACAEPGESGSKGIDCGEHGAEHDGHCHCEEGYLFDGETCVSPDALTTVCGEERNDADAGGADTEDDHSHAEACRCPNEGECPCHGEVVTLGGQDYCEPDMHHE